MSAIINEGPRSTRCWVRPNEFCQVGSCSECRTCLEALSQVTKKLVELRETRASEVAHIGQRI